MATGREPRSFYFRSSGGVQKEKGAAAYASRPAETSGDGDASARTHTHTRTGPGCKRLPFSAGSPFFVVAAFPMAHFRQSLDRLRGDRFRSGPSAVPQRRRRRYRPNETRCRGRNERPPTKRRGSSGDAAGSSGGGSSSINTAANAHARHTESRRAALVAAPDVSLFARAICGPYGIRLGQTAPRKAHLISRQTVNKPSRHR